jgi:hypothetical protein
MRGVTILGLTADGLFAEARLYMEPVEQDGAAIDETVRKRGAVVLLCGGTFRALVRPTPDAGPLRALGADVRTRDLSDRASLERALDGATVVVTTATAIGQTMDGAQHGAATSAAIGRRSGWPRTPVSASCPTNVRGAQNPSHSAVGPAAEPARQQSRRLRCELHTAKGCACLGERASRRSQYGRRGQSNAG